jgi:hypothetical protein
VGDIVGYWEQAGLADVQMRRMSLGGGIVISAVKHSMRERRSRGGGAGES